MPLAESDIVKLVRADMERSMAECQRILEAELFKVDPFLARVPIVPPTRWQRLRWTLQRVRGYVLTIGQALRGDDLVPARDQDE